MCLLELSFSKNIIVIWMLLNWFFLKISWIRSMKRRRIVTFKAAHHLTLFLLQNQGTWICNLQVQFLHVSISRFIRNLGLRFEALIECSSSNAIWSTGSMIRYLLCLNGLVRWADPKLRRSVIFHKVLRHHSQCKRQVLSVLHQHHLWTVSQCWHCRNMLTMCLDFLTKPTGQWPKSLLGH